jgi:hypothetical protein
MLFTPQQTPEHLSVYSKEKKLKAVIWILKAEAIYYTENLVAIYRTSRYYLQTTKT